MAEATPAPRIRPALETLRELEGGKFMDKLALAIHEAAVAVKTYGRKGTVNVSLEIAMLAAKETTEPVLTIEVDLSSKLPQAPASKTIFFLDEDDNPTRNQQRRQRDLDLVGSRPDSQEQAAS